MNKRLIRSVCALLGMSMILTACSGGEQVSVNNQGGPKSVSVSGSDDNLNELGEFPICKEPITLTVGIPQNVNVEDYETNEYTLMLEEKANINLEFQAFPAKDAGQKLEIMIASGGELPDLLIGFGFNDAALYKYGSEGYIIPLNDYYENSSKYIKEAVATMEDPSIMDLIKSADGNIYCVPKINLQLANEYPNRSYINKSWLDKLGLEMPTTTDELYNVLKAFKEQDPNGNGKTDEIPMIGSADGWYQKPHDFIMNAFIYNDAADRWIVENGELSVAYNKPEWKEGLLYLNKLCEEGLISNLSFTQDTNQLKAMIGAELPTYIGVITSGSASVFGKDDRYKEYAALLPLEGPNNVKWATYRPTLPDGAFAITSSCKYPEAAFRLADLMWESEISLWSRYGKRDVDWILHPSGIGIGETPLQWGSVQNVNWCDIGAAYRSYDWVGKTLDGIHSAGEMSGEFAEAAVGMHPDEVVKKILYLPDEQEEINEIKAALNNYVNECFVRFIIGDMDIEKEWDSYNKELQAIGLERYIEISQEAYTRMNK